MLCKSHEYLIPHDSISCMQVAAGIMLSLSQSPSQACLKKLTLIEHVGKTRIEVRTECWFSDSPTCPELCPFRLPVRARHSVQGWPATTAYWSIVAIPETFDVTSRCSLSCKAHTSSCLHIRFIRLWEMEEHSSERALDHEPNLTRADYTKIFMHKRHRRSTWQLGGYPSFFSEAIGWLHIA